MNIAVIFAGGTGQRMKTATKPKQFLELYGKPIIIYTLEHFECHEQIDGIILVCLESWIDYCKKLITKYGITKVKSIVPGGETGLLSRYEGIKKAGELFPDDTVCLIHDGVRPIINETLISNNIESVKKYGSGVTAAPAIETIAVMETNNDTIEILDRSKCQMAKAPQSFYLGDLLSVHKAAIDSGMKDCIDTAYLMQQHGFKIHTVEGSSDNIKITTPADFYTFRALMDNKENAQVYMECRDDQSIN